MVLEVTKQLIKRTNDPRLKKAFSNVNLITAFKQPPNLLRRISHSAFLNNNNNEIIPKLNGLFKCSKSNCKICHLYIQEGDSFVTSNGTTWIVKCHATCNSRNVLYYLKCKFCNFSTTYTGKTDNIRNRTNGHISDIRCNRGGDFDEHVRNCAKTHNEELIEPFFEARIFMVLKDYNNLLDYEAKLHAQGHDTMNRPT